jgi:hypothetical protein
MGNEPKLTMTQGMQITQTLTMCIVPLMTPRLRRSREQRLERNDEDETPWRDPRNGPR